MKDGTLFRRQLSVVSLNEDAGAGTPGKMAPLCGWSFTECNTGKGCPASVHSAVGLSSAAAPLKSALKSSISVLAKDLKRAKTVTFQENLNQCGDDELVQGSAISAEDFEVMKQAVVEMGDHTEPLVQLLIDAQNLLKDDKFLFSNSVELCLRADFLAQNLLLQEDLRQQVDELKKRKKEGVSDDHSHTANDDNNDGSDVKSFGETAGPGPLAGMLGDGQLPFPSPSSSSSSASNVSSFPANLFDSSALSPPTASISPQAAAVYSSLFLATCSFAFVPSPNSSSETGHAPPPASSSSALALAPGPASAPAPKDLDPRQCLPSGMSAGACDGSESVGTAAKLAAGEAIEIENGSVAQDAKNGALAVDNVAENTLTNHVGAAAERVPGTQSLAEMRAGPGACDSVGAASRKQEAREDTVSSVAVQRYQALVTDNRRLKERKKCRACRKVDLSESGITFLPCGHFITCETCSELFDDCPACGKNIMATVRTFLS